VITWLGQEEQKSPEDAAAEAAFNEAQNASWPPKREEVKDIGGAAGSAAGTATCTALAVETGGVTLVAEYFGICSSIGEAIGNYLGGAIYDIIDGFFAGEVFVAPQYDHVFYQRTRRAAIRLANLRLQKAPLPAPSQDAVTWELLALENWGVPGARLAAGPGPTDAEEGPWRPYYSEGGLDDYLKKLAAAESAIASAIIAEQKLQNAPALPPKPQPQTSSSALPVVAGVAVAAGILWALFAL
jgi:hypothetical protein